MTIRSMQGVVAGMGSIGLGMQCCNESSAFCVGEMKEVHGFL